MRARNVLVVGLLAAMMMAGGTIASAQKEPAKQPPDPFQNLGLSGEQKGKVDVLVGERKTALTESQRKIIESRKKLAGLLFDKKVSEGEIDKAADQLAKSEKGMLLVDVKFHKALRKVLTQEQLNSLVKGRK